VTVTVVPRAPSSATPERTLRIEAEPAAGMSLHYARGALSQASGARVGRLGNVTGATCPPDARS
jgi:hypothetical protein